MIALVVIILGTWLGLSAWFAVGLGETIRLRDYHR